MKIIPLIKIYEKIRPDPEKLIENEIYELYLLNLGKNLDIKLIEDLSDLFKIWYEPCKTVLDVIDLLVAGCHVVVFPEGTLERTLLEALKYTDRVGLRIEDMSRISKLTFFIENGGKFVISSSLELLKSIVEDSSNRVFISESIASTGYDTNIDYLVVPYEVICGDRKI